MAKKNLFPLIDDPTGVQAAAEYIEANIQRLPTFASHRYHEVEGGSASDLIDWMQSRGKSSLVQLWKQAVDAQHDDSLALPTSSAILQAHHKALAQFAGTRWHPTVLTCTAEALCAIQDPQWVGYGLEAVRRSWIGSPPVDICGELIVSGIVDPIAEAGIK